MTRRFSDAETSNTPSALALLEHSHISLSSAGIHTPINSTLQTHATNRLNTRSHVFALFHLPQVMKYKPTEGKKHHNTNPEDPLVLLCPSFNRSNGIARDTKCVCNTVKSLLRSLQDFLLLAQITQYSLSSSQILVQCRVSIGKEILLPQCMLFPRRITTTKSQA